MSPTTLLKPYLLTRRLVEGMMRELRNGGHYRIIEASRCLVERTYNTQTCFNVEGLDLPPRKVDVGPSSSS